MKKQIEKMVKIHRQIQEMNRDEYKCKHYDECDIKKLENKERQTAEKLRCMINDYLGIPNFRGWRSFKWKNGAKVKKSTSYDLYVIEIPYKECREYYCLKTMLNNNTDTRECYYDLKWLIYP